MLTPEDIERRFAAKRNNERVKLVANLMNTLSLAILGAAFVIPSVSASGQVHWIWIPIGLALHLIGHWVIRFLRSED